MSLNNNIKNIVFRFAKKKYKQYLTEKEIVYIDDDDLIDVISEIYDTNKDELKNYVVNKLKQHMENEYPGDNIVNPLLNDMIDDDINCKTRIAVEVQYYQDSKKIDKKNSNK